MFPRWFIKAHSVISCFTYRLRPTQNCINDRAYLSSGLYWESPINAWQWPVFSRPLPLAGWAGRLNSTSFIVLCGISLAEVAVVSFVVRLRGLKTRAWANSQPQNSCPARAEAVFLCYRVAPGSHILCFSVCIEHSNTRVVFLLAVVQSVQGSS